MDHSILTQDKALGPVFCDWLTVTCNPSNSFEVSVLSFLDNLGAEALYSDETSTKFRVGRGVVKVATASNHHLVSASGGVFPELRVHGAVNDYLESLAVVPHTVTRIDVARDFSVDGPVAIEAMKKAYPLDRVNLSRKALRVTRMESNRESDGATTGTWYAGHRQKAQVSARVYDKREESISKRGVDLGRPTTRVEMTATKRVGCSLKDAHSPEPLFYHLSSPAICPPPVGVAPWVSGAGAYDWESLSRPLREPYVAFRKKLDYSADVARLFDLAASMGPSARDLVLSQISARLDAAYKSAEEVSSV